jgi:predicted  nucleic acid-binding Zn-ribbon protein
MLADIAAAVRLQEMDQRSQELTKEISALPKHIAEIEKKLESHQRKLDADRAALSGNQKERKRLEGEIQVQQQKISKLKDQMMLAKTNDQYRAFQHEIEFCEKEVRRHEDRILDLMSESDPLEKAVKAAEEALKKERAQVEAEKNDARSRTEADKKQLAEIAEARAALAGSMTPAVRSLYEKAKRARGVAVAEVVDGRCSVCHIAVRPQLLQELRRDDRVMTCESCSRILYYNPPVAVESM